MTNHPMTFKQSLSTLSETDTHPFNNADEKATRSMESILLDMNKNFDNIKPYIVQISPEGHVSFREARSLQSIWKGTNFTRLPVDVANQILQVINNPPKPNFNIIKRTYVFAYVHFQDQNSRDVEPFLTQIETFTSERSMEFNEDAKNERMAKFFDNQSSLGRTVSWHGRMQQAG